MSRTEVKVTTKEAQRQRLIIEELKQVVQRKKEELGRPLFSTISTFGCQMILTVGIFKPLTINGRGTSVQAR
jgi:hypothetical protein